MKHLSLQLLNRSTGKIVFLLIMIFSFLASYASTKTALASGNWDNGASWSGGSKPGCGDVVVIPAGITVSITVQQDYSPNNPCSTAMSFTINGTLKFETGKKLLLPCNSYVYIGSGGIIDPGNGGGNSNTIEICDIVVWKAADGPLTGPSSLGVSPLPVELIDFSGTCIVNGVQLNWTTASELNNNYFLIEKSTNATEWTTLAKVSGRGTSGAINKYIHTDTESSGSMVYYRLSQIDLDGKITVFKTLDVQCDKNTPDQMILFPNPASTEINIILNINNPIANGTIKLFNNVGVIVLETKVDLNNGINSFVFPIEADAGSYHILFSSNDVAISSQKLLIFKP